MRPPPGTRLGRRLPARGGQDRSGPVLLHPL